MQHILKMLMIMLMMTSTSWANALPTTTVSGFVYDKANGEALIGANVFLANTMMGSSSNLAQVGRTYGQPAGFPCSVECWQKKRSQDGDYGDHYPKFYQSKVM